MLANWTTTQALAALPPELRAWAPIAMFLAIAAAFGAAVLIASALIGRRRSGPVKDSAYESGVAPSGDARRPFHVRYYIVAMIFLVFDVEVVLLLPWAVIFGGPAGAHRDPVLLGEMAAFVLVLLVGYVYAWRRGVLQFD